MKKEFNLLDENWVRVLLPNYTVKEVSLKDVFTTVMNTWIWQVKQILKMSQ